MSNLPRKTRLACDFSRLTSCSSLGTVEGTGSGNGIERFTSQEASHVDSDSLNPTLSSSKVFDYPITAGLTSEKTSCMTTGTDCAAIAHRNVVHMDIKMEPDVKETSDLAGSRGWATWKNDNAPSFKDMNVTDKDYHLQEGLLGQKQPSLSNERQINESIARICTKSDNMPLIDIWKCTTEDPLKSASREESLFKISQDSLFDAPCVSGSDCPQGTDPVQDNMVSSTADTRASSLMTMNHSGISAYGCPQNDEGPHNFDTYQLFGTADLLKDFRRSMTSSTSSGSEMMSSSSADSFLVSSVNPSGTRFEDIPEILQEEVRDVLADCKGVLKHMPSNCGDAAMNHQTKSPHRDMLEDDSRFMKKMECLTLQDKQFETDINMIAPGDHAQTKPERISCLDDQSSKVANGKIETPQISSEFLRELEDHNFSLDTTQHALRQPTKSLYQENNGLLNDTPLSSHNKVGADEDKTGALREAVTSTVTSTDMSIDTKLIETSEELMGFTSLPPLEETDITEMLSRSNSTTDQSMFSASASLPESSVPFERYLSKPGLHASQNLSNSSVKIEDISDDNSTNFLSAKSTLSLGQSNSFHGKRQDLPPSVTHGTGSVTIEDFDEDSATFLSARQKSSLCPSNSFHEKKAVQIPIEDTQEIQDLMGSLYEGAGVVEEVREKSVIVHSQGDDTIIETVRNSRELALNKPNVQRYQTGKGQGVAIAVSNSQDVQAVGSFHYNKQVIKVSASEETAKNIKSQMKSELLKSKPLFIKTRTYDAVASILETEQMVFVIGPSGIGKRMIALQLLRQSETEGFEPLILRNVDEMRQMMNTKAKQAILMRNIFGAFEFDQKKFDEWVEYFDTVEVCADEKKKFIFTSKCGIFERGSACLLKTSIFKEELVVDLLQLDGLSCMEKRRILHRHLKEGGLDISEDLIDKIVQSDTPHVFPKCCQMFVKLPDLLDDDRAVAFFQRPVLYHRGIIESMANRDDKLPFAVLLLTMIWGQFQESCFLDRDSPDHEKAKKCLAILGYGCRMSWSGFKSTADSLVGTHLKRIGELFIFIDECLYDAVAFVFGKMWPKQLLEACSLQFLCRKIHVSTEQPTHGEDSSIILEEHQFMFLSERLVLELRDGNVYCVSSHNAFTHAPFIRHFVKYCEKLEDFNSVIQCKDNHHSYQFLYWSSWNPQEHLFKWIFNEYKKQRIKITKDIIVKIVKACCISGNVEVLKLVFDVVKRVSKMVSSCETTTLVMPPYGADNRDRAIVQVGGLLHAACFHGNLSIVEHLVSQLETPVDAADGYGDLPVNIATKQGHLKIVKFLIANGVRVNRIQRNRKTVMYVACECGQTEVAKVLLEACPKLLQVEGVEPHLRYPIHVATMSRQPKLVQILLHKGADPEILDSSMNTAFHTACMKSRNLQILKEMKPSGTQINLINKRNKTCLHLACKFGDSAMVDFLISKGANINAADYKRQTPLHIACEKNHRSIVEKLLAKDADLLLLDIQGKAALYRTSDKSIQKLIVEGISKSTTD